MTQQKICILILGKSGAGKSTLATKINEKLNLKLIRYDVIIDLVCEYTRFFFENKKNEEPLVMIPDTFSNISDLKNFRIGIESLIEKYENGFYYLYQRYIAKTLSRKEWRELGFPLIRTKKTTRLASIIKYIQYLPEQFFLRKSKNKLFEDSFLNTSSKKEWPVQSLPIKKRKKLTRLGSVAKYVQKLSSDIFYPVSKYSIKDEKFVMIEGFFFEFQSYLNDVLNFFDDVLLVKISYNQHKDERKYEYKSKIYFSLDDITKTVLEDFTNLKNKS